MFDYIYIFIFIYIIHYQIYQIQDVAPQLQVSFFQPHFQIHSLVRYISTINHRFFQPRFLFGNGEHVLRRGHPGQRRWRRGIPELDSGIPMGFPVKWPPFWVLRYTNYWKYLEIYIDIPFHFYDMLFVNVFVARSGWLWDEPVPRVLDDLGWQHDLGNLHRWYKFAFSDALLWHYCECIF